MTTPQTVPYEQFQREHEKRLQAEQKCKKLQDEIFLLRKIRHAPVIKAIDKDVLEEFHHVQRWGIVEDGQGNKRANYNTIAKNLHVSPDTVKRSAERLEKLHLADIREHQGPEDERERKYIQVKEENLRTIDKLKDTDGIVPKQGGNRYICTKCDSPDVDVKTETKTTIRCNCCQHEEVVEDTIGNTNWKPQFVHKRQKAQKQLAFQQSVHKPEPTEQLADHSVYTLPLIAELKALRIWCPHRGKVPYNVVKPAREYQKAEVDNPDTWTTYDQSLAVYEEFKLWKHPFDGIGFMNTGDYVFTDIDHCRNTDTGELSDQAQDIILRIDSYAEESYSGTGCHIIARGSIPRGRKHDGVEMYPARRFFTFTGRHILGIPTDVVDSQAAFDVLYKELFPADIPQKQVASTAFACNARSASEILENGKDDKKFMKLYSGNASDYRKKDGSPDYSRADLALCEKIAYWGAGGSVSTIDGIYRQSGLNRPKWERDDYRERTINRAIALYEQQRERIAS